MYGLSEGRGWGDQKGWDAASPGTYWRQCDRVQLAIRTVVALVATTERKEDEEGKGKKN